MKKPVVGVLCSTETIAIAGWGELSHQAVFVKYLDAMTQFGDCSPVLIPSLLSGAEGWEISDILDRLDGVLLPGAGSNIDTALYAPARAHVGDRDCARDQTAMRILQHAASSGLPVLGICRGMQEINVALGGTLYTALHEVCDHFDHRAQRDREFQARYSAVHRVSLPAKGWLARNAGTAFPEQKSYSVNSLHGQGIDRLADSLQADAYAEDGTVEAISHVTLPIFGVQWHPEWNVPTSPLGQLIWARFRDACHAFMAAPRKERV